MVNTIGVAEPTVSSQGDISKPGDALLPPETKKLEERFGKYKQMVDEVSAKDEKLFMLSPRVLSTVMGFDADVSLEIQEAKVLYETMKNVGIHSDYCIVRFGLGDRQFDDYIFMHKEKAKKVLENPPLNVKGLASEDEVIDTAIELLSCDDLELKGTADGLFAGIPLGAVNWYAKTHATSKNIKHYRMSPEEEARFKVLPVSLEGCTTEQWQRLGRTDVHMEIPKNNTCGISGLGVTFNSPTPLPEDVKQWCISARALDEALGISQYIREQRFAVFDKVE